MKIGINVRTEDYSRAVRRKAKDGSVMSLGHAGAVIRLTARRSIRKRKGRSQPGTPPSTRQGALRRAIVYAVEGNAERVVIGPDYAVVGDSARAHEFGGHYRGDRYERRPFMGPALLKTRDRLPEHWAGSVS